VIHAYVPTGRVKEDYRLHIKNKRDYDIAVASGVGWVAYYNLPVDWRVAEKEIEEYQVNLNLEGK
jgi:hypothetical protein